MNELEIKKIESELGIQVPARYKTFLLDFPDYLVREDDMGIFSAGNVIISATKSARNYKEDDWPEPFSADLLVVGWNGGGSCYCVRQGEDGDKIYLFDHEWGSINPEETLGLQEFIQAWRR